MESACSKIDRYRSCADTLHRSARAVHGRIQCNQIEELCLRSSNTLCAAQVSTPSAMPER